MSQTNNQASFEAWNASLHAYPNPFNNRLNIEFTLLDDSKVTLEVFDVAGKRLATLFDGEVNADEVKKVEYYPVNVTDGMIIYRLQTEQGIWHNKAMLVK